ncbi:hypothetical protein [Micromonospora inaquosa]|uniref:hypothetical protein n=1 Tax=Micromonospora inaquosa TaxID=2203716 RepID=UPI000F5F097D|nr:hypothetical protein [Micromonospora inaquosa]
MSCGDPPQRHPVVRRVPSVLVSHGKVAEMRRRAAVRFHVLPRFNGSRSELEALVVRRDRLLVTTGAVPAVDPGQRGTH